MPNLAIPPASAAVPSRASVGSRAAAYIFDLLILVLLWTIGAAWAAIANPGTLPSAGVMAAAGAGWCLSEVVYFAVLETILGGQTPGKRAVGIRVVDRNGAAPGVGAAAIRNVLRIIDTLPFGYAVGTLLMVRDDTARRLGDHLAGTHVVHVVGPQASLPHVHLPETASDAERAVLQTWAARDPQLHPRARLRLAVRLVAWIDTRWPHHLPDAPTPHQRLLDGLQLPPPRAPQRP